LALGDYILCCKCDTKLIYDGDRGNREWWQERFGEEPAILCPNCDKQEWAGLTEDEIALIRADEREACAAHYLTIMRKAIANEREACAKVCDELETNSDAEFYGYEFSKAIRARANT